MTDKIYAVIFRGDVVMGQSLPEVKQNLKRLFKVDDARVDTLFSGKPIPLKRQLSESEAQRYQSILKQAGAVVAVEALASLVSGPSTTELNPDKSLATAPASGQIDKPEVTPSSEVDEETLSSVPTQAGWDLAPVGSQLGQSNQLEQPSVDIKTNHMTVMPQEGNLLKDSERQVLQEADIDSGALDWELTPYGEALLKETEKVKVKAMEVDTSDLSVAEMEGNLIGDTEKPRTESVQIDTSHLQLVSEEDKDSDTQP